MAYTICHGDAFIDGALPFEERQKLYLSCHEDAYLFTCRTCGQWFIKYYDEYFPISCDCWDDYWVYWIPVTADEATRLGLLALPSCDSKVVMDAVYEYHRTRPHLFRSPEGEYVWRK